MAEKVKFVINKREFQKQILMGEKTGAWLASLAAAVAPPGTNVRVAVSSNKRGGGRIRARIEDDSPDAMFREARTGYLSQALGRISGDQKVWYTTKSGKRRLASQAEVNNWTRGRRS